MDALFAWACASPRYLAAHGTPTRLSEINGHACLTLHAMDGWPFIEGGNLVTKRVAGYLAASSVDTVHAACFAGAGLALLTYWDVAVNLADHSLSAIHLSDAQPELLAIWAVLPTRLGMPARVRQFLDRLKATLAGPRPFRIFEPEEVGSGTGWSASDKDQPFSE